MTIRARSPKATVSSDKVNGKKLKSKHSGRDFSRQVRLRRTWQSDPPQLSADSIWDSGNVQPNAANSLGDSGNVQPQPDEGPPTSDDVEDGFVSPKSSGVNPMGLTINDLNPSDGKPTVHRIW